MLALAAPLPDAVIGLVPDISQMVEHLASQRQGIFMKFQRRHARLMKGVDQFAVDIELQLGMRGIADPNGLRAFITGQPACLPFQQAPLAHDAVHDLHVRWRPGDGAQQPVVPGGRLLGRARNWDYRFCWPRDATFTVVALLHSDSTEAGAAWYDRVLGAGARAARSMAIMYGIMGQRRLLEWEAGWLPGYEGAQPVRVGNAAHAQLQLDVYGELIDAFHQSRMAALELHENSWALGRQVLDHLADVWDQPDHGIWERRGEGKHYVSSKVMTWVAFDRGIKSAERFGLDAPLDRWRMLRDAICLDVCEKGFDREQNAFVESYGSQLLDASILLLPAVGFLPASDPRVRGTIAAIEKYMMRDGFVLRHDPREAMDEAQPIEGAFLACSLWLADAYVLAGEIAKAQVLFDSVVAVANDLGLLAEEFDSGAGRQTGNFPQALTHIALIHTAHNLSVAKTPAANRAIQRATYKQTTIPRHHSA